MRHRSTTSTTQYTQSSARLRDPPIISAPNISLNVNKRVPQAEIYCIAVSAVSLQVAVLVYAYNSTCNARLRRSLKLESNPLWAWYCTLIGTVLLVAGVLACCLIIEKSTVEKRYRLKSGDGRLLWLQKGQTVSDQVFSSSAILAKESTSTILTSRRNDDLSDLFHPKSYAIRYGTIGAVILSISGFIIQFMGLRGMHWSVSVAQFISTAVMSVLRAVLRRGLSDCPEHHQLPRDHEIDWLSVRFSEKDGGLRLWDRQPTLQEPKPPRRWLRDLFRVSAKPAYADAMDSFGPSGDQQFKWNIVSEALNSGYDPPNAPLPGTNRAQCVVNSRERLGYLTRWPSAYSDQATSLVASIECIMNFPDLYNGTEPFVWWMRATTGGGTSPAAEVIEFRINRVEDRWVVNLGQIEAVLSLWMYSVKQSEGILDDVGDARLRSGKVNRKPTTRPLGRSTPLLRRDLRWWMGMDAQSIMDTDMSAPNLTGREPPVVRIKQHEYRVVGSVGRVIENDEVHKYLPMSFVNRDVIKKGDPVSANYHLQHIINGVLICTNSDMQCPGFLFSFTQSSLQSTFALEIFTAFIWAFAASPGLRPIGVKSGVGGRTKLVEYSQSQSKISQIMNWDTIRLQSPTLSNIISELEKTGLGNSSQLFLSIVPPLSLHRKLPDTYIVVENIHQRTKDLQCHGRWREIFNMYYWLLHCFLEIPNHNKMPTGSNTGLEARSLVMAIAVSMEFLWSLGEEIQRHKNEGLVLDKQLVRDHKYLRALLTDLKFRSLTKDVLLGLANLYDIQDRKITWEPLCSNYNSHLRDSFIPRVTELHSKIIKGEYKGDPIADVDQKDDLGWTALHYMAKEGRVDIISHLADNGFDLAPSDHADWRAINLLGWTPLHYAALNSSLRLDWAHKMDKQKFDVNIQGRDGVSPLHCAGRSNNVHMATHLIRLGANLDARDNSRKTPLHWSAYHCSTETFKLMLVSGAEFRSPDEYGRTSLHLAGMAGSMEIVTALLRVMNVAEINLKERGGRTALVMACIFGHENVVETLKGHSNDIIPDGLLYAASKKGLSNTVKSLLQQPTNKSPTNEECEHSLYIASKYGHVEIVRLLLENRDGVGSGITSDDRSPLFAASKHYHLETIKLLLGEGFRMTGCRKKWEMLVAKAAMREEHEIVELLSNMLNEGNDALNGGSKYHNTSFELDDSDGSSLDSDWES